MKFKGNTQMEKLKVFALRALFTTYAVLARNIFTLRTAKKAESAKR
jgi:hypothetical protein